MVKAWREDIKLCLKEAEVTGKPVLIFFYSPACYFCQQMERGVFSKKEILARLAIEFVLLRITPDAPADFRNYNINATPAFLILGPTGMEFERFTGFLDTPGLMAFCLLGLGKWRYDLGQADIARDHMEELTSLYAGSVSAAEGLFLRGIYRYRTTKDRSHLRESYDTLARQYPDSPWVKRSRLLHLYPCAFFKLEAYRNQGWAYWEDHQIVKELPPSSSR